jgi:hypothetical protein
LKTDSLSLLNSRKGIDNSLEISKEDINRLESTKYSILKYPVITGLGSAIFTYSLGILFK